LNIGLYLPIKKDKEETKLIIALKSMNLLVDKKDPKIGPIYNIYMMYSS